MTDMRYPDVPGFKARDTARQAALDFRTKAPTIRLKVLELLDGVNLTADEAANELNLDKLAVRPRFSELARQGLIVDLGQRRRNESGKQAIVWCLK